MSRVSGELVAKLAVEELPRHNLFALERVVRRRPLGAMKKLPQELLLLVLELLDLQSLCRLSQASFWARLLVLEFRPYREIFEHAPTLPQSLARSHLLSQYSAHQIFHQVLRSDRCSSCSLFGSHVFLLTCERVCQFCFSEDDSFQVIEKSLAESIFQFNDEKLAAAPAYYCARRKLSFHDQDASDSNHGSPQPSNDFPWHLGAYDAHCHPTDTMASIDNLAGMCTSVLTIMATRSQDQDLVAEVAASHGLAATTTATDLPDATGASRVVPSFAWHPWFSHQLYDDSAAEPTYHQPGDGTSSASSPSEAKRAHYRAVLQPSPDDAFIDSLPDPVPISSFIAATAARLEAHPLALVGEAGLDKTFRLPEQWADADADARDDALTTPGGRDGRRLSPHRVLMAHQQAVLTAQLALAGRYGRAVSLHGVQAHGVLYETVARCWAGRELPSRREQKLVAPGAEDFSSSTSSSEEEEEEAGGSLPQGIQALNLKQKQTKKETGKPYPPRICLHSFSGSASTLAQWMRRKVPAAVYVSFSAAINLSTETSRGKTDEVIRAVPDDRLLVESDLHKAGREMDGMLEVMYRHVCEVKGWKVEDGVARIRRNYEAFLFG
ncbi:hypothetical protein MY11210_001126 [Beauveria gryllotalpidicola]